MISCVPTPEGFIITAVTYASAHYVTANSEDIKREIKESCLVDFSLSSVVEISIWLRQPASWKEDILICALRLIMSLTPTEISASVDG